MTVHLCRKKDNQLILKHTGFVLVGENNNNNNKNNDNNNNNFVLAGDKRY